MTTRKSLTIIMVGLLLGAGLFWILGYVRQDDEVRSGVSVHAFAHADLTFAGDEAWVVELGDEIVQERDALHFTNLSFANLSTGISDDFPGGNIIVEKIDENDVYMRQDLRDTDGIHEILVG